nr:sec1 family domain-containing protein 2-like [Lytechinus pictus]
MSSKNFVKSCQDNWRTVIPYVPRSVIFLDGPAAEALHWTSGAATLFQAGCQNVKEFSSFESCTEDEVKAVFIISDQITTTTQEILEDIICASHFQYCVLITTLPESLHQHLSGSSQSGGGEGSGHQSLFQELEEKMRGWMRHKTTVYEADVVHIPLSVACVSPNLFFLPSFTSFFPLLDIDLVPIRNYMKANVERKPPESLSDVDISMLPDELQHDIKMVVSTLSCLCETLDVNEDIYCLGPTSQLIAGELAQLISARARRKAANSRASILFIDRTLDMVAPTTHGRDSFADRIMSALTPLEGHSCDVAVDMSALCSAGSQYKPSVLLPGCLAHPADQQSQDLLQTLITSKQKESLMDVNRRVVETITREKLPFDPSAAKIGRINADSLQSHLNNFKNNPTSFRNACPLLQVASACVQTLTSPILSHWDDLQTTEKMLLQNAGEGNGPSVTSLILDLLQNQVKQGRSYSLEEVVKLMVYGYSLMGDEAGASFDEERQLQKHISQLITQAPSDSEVVRLLVKEERSEATAQNVAKEIMSRVKSIARSRNSLQRFMDIFTHGTATHPSSYSPLVKQIMKSVFDSSKPDLVDIEYKSSGFRDLLKSGFRLFMNVGKPRPSDHPLFIIFMVGGITCSEVKQIKETVASLSPNTQVVVGSTRILRESDVLDHVFGQKPLSY